MRIPPSAVSSVVVVTAQSALRSEAVTLAHRLGLRFVDALPPQVEGVDFALVLTPQRLELREQIAAPSRPLYVDFVRGPTGVRRFTGQSRRQPLARAVGLKGTSLRVIDATAGLGRDAFLLACLGCDVTMIERSKVLAALLADGLIRAARRSSALDRVLGRLTLHESDACDFLRSLPHPGRPEVIYLDPMYAPSNRTALAKKELYICRRLVGQDPDAGELFAIAKEVATKRVVVKRHPGAPPLAPNPTLTVKGTTVRYDVYLRPPASSGSGMVTSKSNSNAAS